MKNGQGVVVAALLLLGVVGTLYFLLVPGRAAGGYRDDARPALARDRAAMAAVYRSFTPAAFAFDRASERAICAAGSPRAYLGAIGHAVGDQRGRLRAPRAAIDRARRALDEGHHALADLSEPPLLGGRGRLADARAVRDDATEYEDQSAALLNDYGGLLDYQDRSLRLSLDFAGAYAGSLARVAERSGDLPGAARTLDAGALRAARVVAALRRLRPPGPLVPNQRAGIATARFVALRLHEAALAIRARDRGRLAAANRALRTEPRRLAAGSPGALRALIEGSSVRLRIDRTRRLGRDVARALAAL